uniref:Helitron helicase-like domain-containing protein n=1 Tax=Octopus bimaculoides TaxID=37653 RepID=A0A0L8HBE7_OCTBM
MNERTQGAITYMRNYGRLDLFITCNPKWNKIQAELFPGQLYINRHNLVARVFHLKISKLMEFITKSYIFRPRRCRMYTIEWQKEAYLTHIY